MVNTPQTRRVLDLTEVGSALRQASGQINRFAKVTHSRYMGILGNLLYQVGIYAGPQAYLYVAAHTLSHDWFGVRGVLAVDDSEALCAAWMFSDAKRPSLDNNELCVKCLKECSGKDACPYADIEVTQIPISQLKTSVSQWVRSELPAHALRNPVR